MKVKTSVKAGGYTQNRNEALVRAVAPKGLKVKTHVKAGGNTTNHNETFVRTGHPNRI